MTGSPPRALRRWSQILILLSVAIVVVLVLSAKGQPSGPVSSPGTIDVSEAPEVTLDRALAAGRPTLAFFHSLTCESCIEMTAIVGQVYPEFRGTITLVDVNVYEDRNQPLLTRAKILGIPTLVLMDRTGRAQSFPGVMDARLLRQHLQGLAGGG